MSAVQAALSGPDLVKRVALSTLADGRAQHAWSTGIFRRRTVLLDRAIDFGLAYVGHAQQWDKSRNRWAG